MKVDKNKYFNQPLYAIFIKESAVFANGSDSLLGYVEHSFSMSYDANFVRLWEKKDINHVIENNFKKYYKSSDYFVARVRSKKCPAKIIFRDLNNHDLPKFYFRNQQFVVSKDKI